MSLRETTGRYWLPLALTFLLLSTTAFAQNDTAPKVDIFGGYSWLNPGGRVAGIKLPGLNKGFGIASTYNFNKYVGLTADVDAHYGDVANLATFTIGPRLKFREEHFQPFLEAMVGLHRLSVGGIGTDNRIGTVLGGGIDIPITPRVGLRLLQADYVYGHHNFTPIVPGTQNLTGARVRSGILINLGNLGPPPAPLAATCSVNPASVMAGEPVTMTTTASNIPKNHTVTYAYKSTGGTVSGKDTTATIDTNGLAPGSYTVTATVTDPKDKKGTPATCNGNFTIQEPPKHPPTISCSANPTTVQSGQPATISATGSSPDNRPLTYSFTASGGRITPNGQNATLDTAGASAGSINVNCTATDDRGLTANATTSVNVEVPPPPPTASKLNEIQFKDTKKPARVDNEAKAILDDVALRLQRDADAKAVVVGNSAPDEKNGASLAQQRAVNTKAYLTAEKGIDPSRIDLRTGSAGTATSEIWIVPTGATFDQPGTQSFDASKVKTAPGQQYPGQKPARRPAKKAAPKAQ